VCATRAAGGRPSVPNREVEDRADYGRAAGQFERRTDHVQPYAVGRHRAARRRSQIAIIDEHGELTLQKRVPTGRETITELVRINPGDTLATNSRKRRDHRQTLNQSAPRPTKTPKRSAGLSRRPKNLTDAHWSFAADRPA
jgi:hypothetical protein